LVSPPGFSREVTYSDRRRRWDRRPGDGVALLALAVIGPSPGGWRAPLVSFGPTSFLWQGLVSFGEEMRPWMYSLQWFVLRNFHDKALVMREREREIGR
jgi:hypothetical protein